MGSGLKWGTCLIIDGAAIGEPKRRHDVTFPLLTKHAPRKRSCIYFSTGFIQKKILSMLQKTTDELSRTLRLMQEGTSFEKILPKQVARDKNINHINCGPHGSHF
jgi:hypothetical protein